MTRRDEWIVLVAASLRAGRVASVARLEADENLAECDDRFPPDGEVDRSWGFAATGGTVKARADYGGKR